MIISGKMDMLFAVYNLESRMHFATDIWKITRPLITVRTAFANRYK